MKRLLTYRIMGWKGNKAISLFLMKLGYWWKVLHKKEVYYPLQVRKNRFRSGNTFSSWTVCPDGLSNESLVLSFGVGKDISWETAIVRKYGCRILLFDPTPASIEWISRQELPPNMIFFSFGISDHDGTEKFYLPGDANYISASVISGASSSRFFEAEVHTLNRILDMTGVKKADILKMDIEGAEYKVIRNLQMLDFRPQQILIEFHHRFPEIQLSDTRDAIKTLNEMGYRIFYISPNGEEYSFIRI